ncbi:hypothetical protein CAS74_003052 [Pichia kudriavzevii]|uniref:Serine/threonine-protein kinase TEL1 n=1 Tax=Pichia kudriavzevii TaxID=4909 RepID=A0A1Z8JNB1_PICKU|nr:hypothetical protein CAS74_003052 [Pichia kudriavzevii]
MHVFNTPAQLVTNKVKDKNDAIEKLQNINFASPSTINSFDPEALLKLVNSLDLLIDSDLLLYSKPNSSSIVEIRLNKVSTVLRSILVNILGSKQSIALYKPRQSEKIINTILKYLTYTPPGCKQTIVEPLMLNLTKTLYSLFRVQCFRDHLYLKTYESILRKVLLCLELLIFDFKSIANNEAVLIELLSLLYEFLNPAFTSGLNILLNSPSGSQIYYPRIVDVVLNYLKILFEDKNENIINKCLIDLSTSHTKFCYRLYKIGVQLILEAKSITSSRLITEMALFVNLIPQRQLEHKYSGELSFKTPNVITTSSERIGHSTDSSAIINASSEVEDNMGFSEEDEDDGEEKPKIDLFSISRSNKRKYEGHHFLESNEELDNLAKVIDVLFGLFHDTSVKRQIELKYNHVQLHSFPILHQTLAIISWFWSALNCLLPTEARKFEAQKFTDEVMMVKRKRLTFMKSDTYMQISDSLHYFGNPLDLLTSILTDESLNNNVQILTILKTLSLLLGFIFSNSNMKSCYDILEKFINSADLHLTRIMHVFEKHDNNIKYWALHSLDIMFSILVYHKGFETANIKSSVVSIYHKSIKYSLDFLKDPNMSNVSCIFLFHLSVFETISNPLLFTLNKNLVQQYENIIDLAEINGPAILSKEAVLFWYASYNIGKKYKFNNVQFLKLGDTFNPQLFSQKVSNWIFCKLDQFSKISSITDTIPIVVQLKRLYGDDKEDFIPEQFISNESFYDGPSLHLIRDFMKKQYLSTYILKKISPNGTIIEIPPYKFSNERLIVNEITLNKMNRELSKVFNLMMENANISVTLSWIIPIIVFFKQGQVATFPDFNLANYTDYVVSSLKDPKCYLFYITLVDQLHAAGKVTIDKVLLPTVKTVQLGLNLLISSNQLHENQHLSEEDLFDSFMPSSETEITACQFADYNKYNYNSLYFHRHTFEQKIINFVLNSELSTNVDSMFAALLLFTSKVKDKFQLLGCYYEIMKWLECGQVVLSVNIVDGIFNQVTTFLEDHTMKTYEAALICVTRIFEYTSKTWMSASMGIESDGKSVYEYLINLYSKGMIHNELSLIGVFSFFQAIIQNQMVASNLFDYRQILIESTKYFHLFDNYGKFQVLNSVLATVKSQKDIFETYTLFLKSFRSPQQSVESSATFCCFMSRMSNASESLIITTVCNLLELSNFKQILDYMEFAISDITYSNRIPHPNRLFWNFKEVFFKCWESFQLPIENFPFYLFGFSSLDDFFLRSYKEIIASSLAYNHVGIIDTLKNKVNIKETAMIKDSMSLSVTLSWTKGGIRNGIFKIFEKYFSSSKALKSSISEQYLLIVFQLLRFCDCSSEEELLSLFEGPNHFDLPLSIDALKFEFLEEYDLWIKPKSCVEMINYFGNLCGIENIWSTQIVYHLASKLLLLIESSILGIEKLINLRRLKLLFILSHDGFQSTHVCDLLISNLSSYMKDSLLNNDTAIILTSLLQLNSGTLSNITVYSLVTIICTLLEASRTPDSERLALWVLSNRNKFQTGEFTDIIHFGFDIVEDKNANCLPDLVEFVNKAFRDKSHVQILMHYLSLLFKHNSTFQNFNLKIDSQRLTQEFIQNLFTIKTLYAENLSDGMIQWIGRSLGLYYQNNGKIPNRELYEFDNRSLRHSNMIDFDDEVKSLDTIFRQIIHDLPSSSLRARYCFETIVGVLLQKHNTQAENMSSQISYDELFREFEEFIYPISSYMCSVLIDQVELETASYYKHGLDQALNGFTTILKVYKFERWLSQIVFSIINELSSQSSIMILLANYMRQIPRESIKRGKIIGKMISDFFSQDFAILTKDSIVLFLELVLLIRLGTKNGNEKFVSIYRVIDIARVYEAALFINKNKTALLLFEDHHSAVGLVTKGPILSNKRYESLLKNIYSGIEDNDLIFGLPIVPELDYGLQILRHNNLQWGEMMFNNAKFESNLFWRCDERLATVNKITESMMDMGWSGISSIVNQYSSSVCEELVSTSDAMYEQLWKLNQWDLSIPKDKSTEHQFVYSMLKNINDKPDFHSKLTKDAINDLVKIDISKFHKHGSTQNETLESWVRTLTICNTVDDILGSEDQNFGSMLKKFSASTEWFREATVDEFENILLARRTILSIMSQYGSREEKGYFQISHGNCWLGIVNELNFYNNIMIEKGSTQKAVNGAVFLNEISQVEHLVDNAYIKRIAKYNLAYAFWTQQSDTRFPIETLKDVIETDKTSATALPEAQMVISSLPTELLIATLAKWSDECKQETSSVIMEKYIDPLTELLESIDVSNPPHDYLGLTFHIMAKFCDDQIQKRESNSGVSKSLDSIKLLENDIKALAKFLKEETTKEKKKYAHLDLLRLKNRHKQQVKEVQKEQEERANYITKAVNFYFKSMAYDDHQFIEQSIDRFCSLWIENNNIEIDSNQLLLLPTHNFVTWNNQLVSKLMDERTHFQDTLKNLLIHISLNHPFHTLYLLKSLRITKVESDDPAAISRGNVAQRIWETLCTCESKFNVEGIHNILTSIDALSDKSVEIANIKLKNIKRKDAIMIQVFKKVNKLLWKDIQTKKRRLRIRTYNVLPLGPTSGILEFVPNSMPLVDILKFLHQGDELDINDARLKMKEVQTQAKSVRYQVYKSICKKIQPNLRTFFFNNFTSPDTWFESRCLYSHGVATTSIIGYILGIGDRHCNNILLDKSSGEPIHIDFGVAFDQGKSLPIPETVPFRLTRDLVDGLGVTKVDGMFSKSCEHVLRVLRLNKQYIISILNVLKYDPLYSWTLSPLRKKKLQHIYYNVENDIGFDEFVNTDLGSEANSALKRGLSDEAVVRELIRDAVDPRILH